MDKSTILGKNLRARLWDNIHLRIVLFFLCLYTLCNVLAIDRFDYILVLYLFHISSVTEDTALPLALTFGIFYDLNYQMLLGVGILLFQVMNFAKVYLFQVFDMSKIYSRFLFMVGLTAFYLIATIKLLGFPLETFWQSFAYYFFVNLSAALALWLLFNAARFVRAFR